MRFWLVQVFVTFFLVVFIDSAQAQCKPGQTPVFGDFGGISCKGTPKNVSGSGQGSSATSVRRSNGGSPSGAGNVGPLLGAGTNAAAAIFGNPSRAPSPADASSGSGGAMGYAEQLKACSDVFDYNVKEGNARKAILSRIADDDYQALCRYGNEIGHPGLRAGLDRILASPVCHPSDPIVVAVVKALRINLQKNRQAIDNDCRRAGSRSNPERCGLTQGEKIAQTCTDEAGSRSCYCIPLTNTCKKETNIKIRQSYKITAVANSRSSVVDPETTNYDTCTTKAGSVITLGATRSSKY